MTEITEAEAWYDPAMSTQILGFAGEHEDHPDHVAVKYLDPDDMEVIVDFRFTNVQNLKDHVELLQLAVDWLEETNLNGAQAAINAFGMETIDLSIDATSFTVQDILDAGREE